MEQWSNGVLALLPLLHHPVTPALQVIQGNSGEKNAPTTTIAAEACLVQVKV